MNGVFEKLAAARINLLPNTGFETHFIFERDGFVALVERTENGFGQIGSSALLTDQGMAVLVWRADDPWFVHKGFEQRATSAQVEALRGFAADLHAALR